MSRNILIIDDEKDIRALIRGILEDEGYDIREAANSAEALAAVEESPPDLVVLDIWLQESDQDGLEVLKAIKADFPLMPVLMISGHGTIETAVSAIKQGAYDFIEKPFKSDRLLMMMERALEIAALKIENQTLKAKSATFEHKLIGESAAIHNLKAQIDKIAPTNSRVFITGEGGTGKEVVAKTIHNLSTRQDKAFMAVNCASLHPERLEEELFGVSQEGRAHHKGMLELAHGGTLFLDEIADMPLETQGKILRVLQDNQIQPVGREKALPIDVRFLASTNKDLSAAIAAGDFREDLYYRLNVVTLDIPPLRKRREDIEPLIEDFLSHFAAQTGQAPRQLNAAALNQLRCYDWPGNVRQLKNMMEWVTIMAPTVEDKAILDAADLPPEFSGAAAVATSTSAPETRTDYDYRDLPLREARESFEKAYLTDQIKRFDGNITQTADFIGMERSALHRKLKSLDISLKDDQNGGVESLHTALNKKRA